MSIVKYKTPYLFQGDIIYESSSSMMMDTVVNKAEFKSLYYFTGLEISKNNDIVEPKLILFYGPVQVTSISKAGYNFEDGEIVAQNVKQNIITI